MPRGRTVAAIVWALGAVARAGAATIVVPDDRLTIRDAIASAGAGDTVQVRPGTYAESVLVTGDAKTRLTLEGLGGRPVLRPPAGSDGIRVERARNVTIRSFAVAGGAIGIHVLDSSETVVSDVHVAGSREGIRIRRCRRDCAARESTVEGTTRGPGILVRDSPAVIVRGNVVTGSRREGIRIARSDALSFQKNRVDGSGADGIRITQCDHVEDLEDNVAAANGRSGLRLDRGYLDGACPACGVSDNTADRNGRYGFRVRRWAHVSSAADLTAFENAASGNAIADFRVRP